jgi:DNA-binding transcriptional ArsR family regulator
MDSTGVFAALSDPTRQQLIEWLSVEPVGTATGFAARLPISRQAISRHLSELEEAGLVTSSKVGRETRYSLETAAMQEAVDWLTTRARRWDNALERLQRHVEQDQDIGPHRATQPPTSEESRPHVT